MSGGSYNYAYSRLEDLAAEVELRARASLCPAQRLAFAALLRKCAAAAHDIEWVDSSDYGPGDEQKSIEACLSPGAELEVAIAEARAAVVQLEAAIGRAGK